MFSFRCSGFSRLLFSIERNCNTDLLLLLTMFQTSEGEVVSEDRVSKSRTNGDEFGKPAPLYCGSTFHIACMTSEIVAISNQIFPMLRVCLQRLTHDCQLKQINPYRIEFKSMSLNFKLPISFTALEDVSCAFFRYSVTLIIMIQQACSLIVGKFRPHISI